MFTYSSEKYSCADFLLGKAKIVSVKCENYKYENCETNKNSLCKIVLNLKILYHIFSQI